MPSRKRLLEQVLSLAPPVRRETNAMEEGPEPQEMIERTVEHHHHEGGHAEGGVGQRATTMASAITAAALAVCAAVGSLLSGHAANEGILNESKATDQWSYFQAKSTKQQIYEASAEVVATQAKLQGLTDKSSLDQETAALKAKAARYESEKEKIKEEAEAEEAKSAREMGRHRDYSFGVAAFQVGIVLASISILIHRRALYLVLYLLSLAAGAVGIVYLLLGRFSV
jgi:Domain of unknown function (DUF4337)